jgi:lysophospholipase L1-like esterase
MTKHFHSFLALGDSYTIGEGVPIYESFPYQAVQLLRKQGGHFHAPEIVAKTGWTTSELAEHLINHELNDHYDFVTLLIGVNNQYRGLSPEDYISDFEFLLKKAIHFTSNKKVVVLSIPDWGTTPFAEGRDRKAIASEIDAYNAAKRTITEKNNVAFIDITTSQRADNDSAGYIASDKLHPSGKEYAKWAALVAEKFREVIR